MKIILEDGDITEIIKNHVKSTNLLGLGEKDFDVVVDFDTTNEEVFASIDTAVLTEDKPKRTRRKRSSVSVKSKSEEPAKEEAKTPEPKQEESNEEATSSEDKPPFDTNDSVTSDDVPASKSLFA